MCEYCEKIRNYIEIIKNSNIAEKSKKEIIEQLESDIERIQDRDDYE